MAAHDDEHRRVSDFTMISGGLEVREAAAGESNAGTISGVALTYGDEAAIGGWYHERFEEGAFAQIESRDITLNVAHDRRRPLARSGGGGLRIETRGKTIWIEAQIPNTQDGRDTIALAKRGVYRGLSIEFVPRVERMEGKVRIISRADMYGVGVVGTPAYSASKLAVRDMIASEGAKGLPLIWE